MAKFPSDEWIKIFKDKINKNKEYEEVAKMWEGDFLFIITPDEDLKEELTFYVDLWHGKCRDAYLVRGEKKAAFIFKGPYSNWKKIINKKMDPIRGLIMGMFTLKGDSKAVMSNVRAAQELVNTVAKIPTEFIRE